MGEPLKNKGFGVVEKINETELLIDKSKNNLFHREAVKSAVEWLKEEDKKIEEYFKNRSYEIDDAMVQELFRRFRENRIKAFPDLIHVSHKESTRGKKDE